MYRTARVAIMAPEDTATVYLSGNDNTIPVIGFGRQFSAETFEINLNSQTLSPVQQVAWLRSFAGLVEDLAEQVERRHDLGAIDALREKLATQTPIYCDCGAHELSDRFAVVADPDEAGVTHDRNWCGNREAVAR